MKQEKNPPDLFPFEFEINSFPVAKPRKLDAFGLTEISRKSAFEGVDLHIDNVLGVPIKRSFVPKKRCASCPIKRKKNRWIFFPIFLNKSQPPKTPFYWDTR